MRKEPTLSALLHRNEVARCPLRCTSLRTGKQETHRAATRCEAPADFTALQAGNSTGCAAYLLRADGGTFGFGVDDA